MRKNSRQKAVGGKTVLLLLLLSAFCLPLSAIAQTELHKYRGVYHVHTEFSHDSKASLQTVVKTAKKAGLDFVIVTDHNNMNALEACRKMESKEGDPKLFVGVEVSAPDGHVALFGIREMPPKDIPSQKIMDWAREQGGYAFLAHPVCIKNPWKNWEVKGYAGLEIYNLAHEYYTADKFSYFPKRIFLPRKWFLKAFLRPDHQALALWDSKLKEGKMAAVAAADAHIHFQYLGINFENYLLQFQSSTVYALAPELSGKAVFDAVGKGKSYLAFEAFGDARWFSFSLKDGDRSYTPGETVALREGQVFQIEAPRQAEIRLIHNGRVSDRKYSMRLISDVREKGTYRAEVYQQDKLWIAANPIYVE